VVVSACLIASAFCHLSFAGGRVAISPRFSLLTWFTLLPSHYRWVLAFAALTASIIPLRALQWRTTLGERSPAFAHRYHAVAIGAFFHNAAPGKLGELVRAFLLSRRQSIPFFESLGSVLLCKLLELAALVLVVALALLGPLGGSFSQRLGPALLVALLAFIALAALAAGAAHFALPIGLRLERTGRLPRLRMALMHLGKGLHAIRSIRRTAWALLASFGPVCASALAYGVALQALGVSKGIVAGGIVLGAVSLGQLVPGLPIGMGMYYLTSSWAARMLGAPAPQAAAFAALTHLATFLPQLLIGLVSVIVYRLKPRALLKEQAAAMAAARSAEESTPPELRISRVP
jgi:uncharacterized protein (TIRG00374 family)